MQTTSRPVSGGFEAGLTAEPVPGRSFSAAQLCCAVVAGVALASVGALITGLVGSVGPSAIGITDKAVRLTADGEWDQILATAGDNLQSLETQAQATSTQLSQALDPLLSEYGRQLGSELIQVWQGVENSFDGGWYDHSSGYTFGLFGGTVDGADGNENGSTLTEISTALQQGNFFQAFSFFDTWSLEAGQHILEPLLNPILTVTHHGGTEIDPATLNELLQAFTNVEGQFFTWANLEDLFDAELSPLLGGAFGFTQDLDTVDTDFASGDTADGTTALQNIPADLFNDVFNGFSEVNPVNGSDAPFVGLLNDGSLLDELLVTWPEQLATALNETAAEQASATTATVTDVSGDIASALAAS